MRKLTPHEADLLRSEAIRLRVNDFLSLREIAEQLSVAKSTVSNWLKSYSLPDTERAKRRSLCGGDRRSVETIQSSFNARFGTRIIESWQKGAVAEAATLMRLAALGFETYSGTHDGSKVDLVATRKNFVYRIHIRWGRRGPAGRPVFSLRTSDGRGKQKRFAPASFDAFVGYDVFEDVCYVYLPQEIEILQACVSAAPSAAEAWEKLELGPAASLV